MPVTECPSGLKIQWREMGFGDEDDFVALLDEAEATQMHAFDQLLKNLAEDAPDKGLYRFEQLDLDRILSPDRTKMLVDVRNDAFGEEILVERTCPRGHEIKQVLDLRCLKINPMSAEAKAALKAGKPLEVKLPRCGRIVKWQMLTGELESAMLQALDTFPKQQATETMAIRVVDVEGFDKESGIDPATGLDVSGWLRKLHTRDSRALKQHIVNSEAEVVTTVKIPCRHPRCGREVAINVMLEPGFFPLSVERETSSDSSDSSSSSPQS